VRLVIGHWGSSRYGRATTSTIPIAIGTTTLSTFIHDDGLGLMLLLSTDSTTQPLFLYLVQIGVTQEGSNLNVIVGTDA